MCVEEPSEEDLLSQYSLSNLKKPKAESTEGGEHHEVVGAELVIHPSKDLDHHKGSPNSQPRLRNRFALALHKKNEESGAVFAPGTRSRFVLFKVDSIAKFLFSGVYKYFLILKTFDSSDSHC